MDDDVQTEEGEDCVFCGRCGKNLPDDVKFCQSCRMALVEPCHQHGIRQLKRCFFSLPLPAPASLLHSAKGSVYYFAVRIEGVLSARIGWQARRVFPACLAPPVRGEAGQMALGIFERTKLCNIVRDSCRSQW